MKKVWEVIKKIGIWIGTVFVAIFTVLFARDCWIKFGNDNRRYGNGKVKDDSDEINAKAAQKREEAIERISNTDARTLSESYGTVCDAITDGKARFRRRCFRADD